MITEAELRDALVHQADSYQVPPHDLPRLRATAATRRRRDTRLRYGGMAVATLLAIGVAWGQLRADPATLQPADMPSETPSEVSVSPPCVPAGEVPPVPSSPWGSVAGGYLADQPVPATSPAPGDPLCTLVLRYWFHRFGTGTSGMVWLYSDGRLIVDREAGFVQWERRLTPAGVERIRQSVVSMLGEPVERTSQEFESVIHYGDRMFYPQDSPALVHLLIDPSWLSDEEWVTESPAIYRAAWYLTCYQVGGRHGNDVRAAVGDLPAGARAVLESHAWTTPTPDGTEDEVAYRCVVLSRADANELVEALGGDISVGTAIVFPSGLDGLARQFSLFALMPDGTSGAHGD